MKLKHVDLYDFVKKHWWKINIIVEKDHQFSINSFVRGYYVYTDIWTPNIGDENLYLELEDGNKYGKNAVVVIIDGKTGGHIPKNLSKTFKHFLTLLTVQ